jgi:hypothetical protein
MTGVLFFERTTTNETEPNRGPEINTLTPGVDDIRGGVLNLDGQLDEPAKDRATETTDFETQAVGQEPELELSQLSPRKRSLRRYKAMEPQIDGVTSPTIPVVGLASRSSKKRTAPATTPKRDRRVKKRKGNVTTESETVEELLAPVVVPAEATKSTVEGSSTLVASSDLTATEISRGAVGGPDLVLENEGGGAEESVEDAGKDLALAMDSKSGCENNLKPGVSTTSAKGPSKRLSGPGTRTRVRRSKRLSSSANVGKSLQGRSISNSAPARGAALRASERGRRVALVRARQEARDKKKSDRTTGQQTDSATSSNASGGVGVSLLFINLDHICVCLSSDSTGCCSSNKAGRFQIWSGTSYGGPGAVRSKNVEISIILVRWNW